MICGSAAIQFSLMIYDLVVVYVSWRFLRKPYKWKPVMISGSAATQFSSKIYAEKISLSVVELVSGYDLWVCSYVVFVNDFWFCSCLCGLKISKLAVELGYSDDIWICSDVIFVNYVWFCSSLCTLKISAAPAELVFRWWFVGLQRFSFR
jgi:hypothetical protein